MGRAFVIETKAVAVVADARPAADTAPRLARQRGEPGIRGEGRRAGTFRNVDSTFVAEVVTASMRRFTSGELTAATGLSDAQAYRELARLTLAAVRVGMVMFVMFALLTVTFLVLAIASYESSRHIQAIGGWLGVVTSVVAFYASTAGLVNDVWKRNVLPMLSR